MAAKRRWSNFDHILSFVLYVGAWGSWDISDLGCISGSDEQASNP